MVKLTDGPDMTLAVYCGSKTTKQQQLSGPQHALLYLQYNCITIVKHALKATSIKQQELCCTGQYIPVGVSSMKGNTTLFKLCQHSVKTESSRADQIL